MLQIHGTYVCLQTLTFYSGTLIIAPCWHKNNLYLAYNGALLIEFVRNQIRNDENKHFIETLFNSIYRLKATLYLMKVYLKRLSCTLWHICTWPVWPFSLFVFVKNLREIDSGEFSEAKYAIDEWKLQSRFDWFIYNQ